MAVPPAWAGPLGDWFSRAC